ncbi:phage prohead protease, HK97 family [Saccharopolyspora shandongensis]|uniref:Phage prohead protease, HK97 family n=1 Tax=Saccharopolyspora shandongensis TaxID=418495 RepID=A0A1H3TYB2_9PSEU|nr:HK97 family phage prohead protease [Saccharopolyspora shandongensis]SDZ55234.1 phage prohead protease, HK97 family [Saccharopolyspora shandongensis]
MDTKRLHVEVKDADEDRGEVTAVFSTFNVKDSDQDVTLPGAFEDGAPALISAYGHTSWSGLLPVGKGTITSTKTEAVFTGRFFMDTTHGADTFRTVKHTGELQEWSYGYDPVEFSYGDHDGERVRFLKRLRVHEVSPVMLGAGVGTRTLAAKSAGGMKFSDEAEAVMAAVKALTDRAADVLAKRQEKGKGLGAESTALLADVEAELKRLGELVGSAPAPDVTTDAQREFLRFLRTTRG